MVLKRQGNFIIALFKLRQLIILHKTMFILGHLSRIVSKEGNKITVIKALHHLLKLVPTFRKKLDVCDLPRKRPKGPFTAQHIGVFVAYGPPFLLCLTSIGSSAFGMSLAIRSPISSSTCGRNTPSRSG